MVIGRDNYYSDHEKNSANSSDLLQTPSSTFPKEGILIGDFVSYTGDVAPALIPIDQTNGICFLSTSDNEKEIKQAMQMMALRLVCSIPPTKCKMILYDGQGVGSELIMLSGLNNSIKGECIIDSLDVLKDKLKAVNKEISHIIQTVLGAKYADKTLVEYNISAGELSLPYTFIVIADFPHTLDKEAVDLLLRIVKNGRKAGVFILMNLDTNTGLGNDKNGFGFIDQKQFIDIMTTIYQSNTCDRYYIKNLIPKNKRSGLVNRFALHLDSSVTENLDDIIQQINARAENAKTAKLIMSDRFTKDNLWKGNAGSGVVIPIGMSNDRTVQYFSLGKEHHHCIVGGRSGSGKSVLLHNLICNGSWLYSPNELQFILLDFKDGVEFNAYKDFPNVKILSVQSDTEFALNVFHFLDKEMKERSALIKKECVGNLAEYNQKAKKPLPRFLVIIDEFQKMFDSKWRTQEELNTEINNIVRQGRSFGVNLILCTQSLGDVSISLSEFSLRIGLPFSSEKECRRICYDNTTPLSFGIGQALYCANPDGKNPIKFRVAYMNRSEIVSNLHNILSSGLKYSIFERYLFDGETPADIKNIEKDKKAENNAIYIGSPLSLKKEHAYFKFRREQCSNLLIIGQDVKSATAIVYHSVQQIIDFVSKSDAIFICDKTSVESPTYNKLTEIHTDKCHYYHLDNDNDITIWINSVNAKIDERRSGVSTDYGEIYFFLFNTFNYQPALWRDEVDTPVSRQLINILRNGSNYGIHLIIYSDTFEHYLSTFGKMYKYDWGIKIALSGGDSERMFGEDNRMFNTDYVALFMKKEMNEELPDKIMVYEL